MVGNAKHIAHCFVHLVQFKNRSYFNLVCVLPPPKGGKGIYDVSPPVWNLRAASLIPLIYISSLVLLPIVLSLFLSYPFLLLAYSLDLLFPKHPFSQR